MRIYDIVTMSRKQLYDEIWQISIAGVAKKYSLNYQKLVETLKKENVPYPSSGYWVKLKMEKDVSSEKVPLPETENDKIDLPLATWHNSVDIEKSGKEKEEIIWPDDLLSFLDSEERKKVFDKALSIRVENTEELHPTLVRYMETIEQYKKNVKKDPYYYGYYEWDRMKNQPPFTFEMSDLGRERLYPFLNSLYHAIEELGGTIEEADLLKIRNDTVKIYIKEIPEKVDHVLSKEEQKSIERYEQELKKNKSYAWKPNIRKYDREYVGKLSLSFGGDSWKKEVHIFDTSTRKIENRMGEILIGLYEESERSRIIREKEEERERIRKEREEKEEAVYQAYLSEVNRIRSLLNEIEDYKTACDIRDYIKAKKERCTEGLDMKWVEWANGKADWFDPTIARDDPLLGIRKHGKPQKEKDLDNYIIEPVHSRDFFDDFPLPWDKPDEKEEYNFFQKRDIYRKLNKK